MRRAACLDEFAMDHFESEKTWLHRKGTARAWEFKWDERRKLLIHKSRKHTYAMRYCRYAGFWIARLLYHDGREYGWVQDHAYAKPREIEFENGGRYIFP